MLSEEFHKHKTPHHYNCQVYFFILCSDSICQEICKKLWEDVFSRKGGRGLSSRNANPFLLQYIDLVRYEPDLQLIKPMEQVESWKELYQLP